MRVTASPSCFHLSDFYILFHDFVKYRNEIKIHFFNKRLDLSQREFDCLIKCIDYKNLKKLIDELNNQKLIEYSFKKHTASENATKVRTDKAKMQITIEMLQTQ